MNSPWRYVGRAERRRQIGLGRVRGVPLLFMIPAGSVRAHLWPVVFSSHAAPLPGNLFLSVSVGAECFLRLGLSPGRPAAASAWQRQRRAADH